MIGPWLLGARLNLSPLADDPALRANPQQNNNFDDDTLQIKCPYTAHVCKRISRAGIPILWATIDQDLMVRQGTGPLVTQGTLSTIVSREREQ